MREGRKWRGSEEKGEVEEELGEGEEENAVRGAKEEEKEVVGRRIGEKI